MYKGVSASTFCSSFISHMALTTLLTSRKLDGGGGLEKKTVRTEFPCFEPSLRRPLAEFFRGKFVDQCKSSVDLVLVTEVLSVVLPSAGCAASSQMENSDCLFLKFQRKIPPPKSGYVLRNFSTYSRIPKNIVILASIFSESLKLRLRIWS